MKIAKVTLTFEFGMVKLLTSYRSLPLLPCTLDIFKGSQENKIAKQKLLNKY